MPAFHCCVAAKSISGVPTRIPIVPAWRIFSTRPAAEMSALDGMHPQLRHTPPTFSRSTSSVRTPSCPRRMAAVYPAGPPPITIASYSLVFIVPSASALCDRSVAPRSKKERGAPRQARTLSSRYFRMASAARRTCTPSP